MIQDKIKSPAALRRIVRRLKRAGKTIAFSNGCFDIIHYGHAQYLQQAKQNADLLIVAVNSDRSVRRLKGKGRPLNTLKDRMRLVAALESVDYVTSFGEDTPAVLIGYLMPHMIIKGSDYRVKDVVGRDIVEPYGGRVKISRYLKGYSVTGLIKKILKQYSRR